MLADLKVPARVLAFSAEHTKPELKSLVNFLLSLPRVIPALFLTCLADQDKLI